MSKSTNGEKYPSLASINSVLSSSAQFATMCIGQEPVEDSLTRLLTQAYANKSIGLTDFAVLTLMNDNGLRISEVLNIKHTDITSNNSILIKGLKGSRDRLVYPRLGGDYWAKCKALGGCEHIGRNRFYYYRLCKRFGLGQGFAGKTNVPTTHAFRHKFVTNLLNQGYTLEQVADVIGHKNVSSTKFYDDRK